MTYDVAIVGYGPVGQVLAGLLGMRGHRVVVVERHHDIYPLPRAVRCDGEVLRSLQRLGVADSMEGELLPVDHYRWFGADGEPILTIDIPDNPSGWRDCLFYQPLMEQRLRERVATFDSVEILLGVTVDSIEVHDHVVRLAGAGDDGVAVDVSARYLVGADGANSRVREALGIARSDLGFSEHWLVVDVRPHDMADFAHLETASQYCDPTRPVTCVGNGRSYRRWEFMLLPGEAPEDFTSVDRVWELLEGVTSPDRVDLIRHAVYNFRSLVAQTLQVGPVFLAGDSAHVMPPFMGEGMCTGVRDANNLAWKLDLVLRGVAPDALLSTYTAERVPFIHHSIAMSVEMGKVSCELDPAAAAGRDAAMRSGTAPPPPPPAPLTGPLVGVGPLAGVLAVQPRLRHLDADVWGDDVLGVGFQLLFRSGDPAAILSSDDIAWFEQIGTIATFDAGVGDCLHDATGVFSRWLEDASASVVLVRPDHYVFDTAASVADGPQLVQALRAALTTDSDEP
jgi:2-polyprenyl-6-methoxyphenol hydroxylase-like FAD-dependent oxidoreductase